MHGIEVIESHEVWRSPGGGTTREVHFVYIPNGELLNLYQRQRVAEEAVADSLGYVGTVWSIGRATETYDAVRMDDLWRVEIEREW